MNTIWPPSGQPSRTWWEHLTPEALKIHDELTRYAGVITQQEADTYKAALVAVRLGGHITEELLRTKCWQADAAAATRLHRLEAVMPSHIRKLPPWRRPSSHVRAR